MSSFWPKSQTTAVASAELLPLVPFKGPCHKIPLFHLLHVKAAYQWNVTCESSAFPLLVGTCVVMLATLQPTDSEEKYEDIHHFILRLLRCKFNAYAFEVFTHRNFVFLVCSCDSWKYRNIFFLRCYFCFIAFSPSRWFLSSFFCHWSVCVDKTIDVFRGLVCLSFSPHSPFLNGWV